MLPETPGLAGFEFCKFMSYGMSLDKLVLPDKLASALTVSGRELRREVKLRVADGGERRAWDVEVVANEYGDVYLAGGWREFARANGLEVGQLLVFRYDGAALITVTIFEDSQCRRHCQHEEVEEEEALHQPTGSGSSSGGGGTAEAGTDDPASPQFSVMLTKCHFGEKKGQYLNVPAWFQEAHGYKQRSKVVLRMHGESWTVSLKHNKRSGGRIQVWFRYGWHQFCLDNGLGRGDTCFFHALQEEEGEDHVLRVQVRKQDGTLVQ